MKWTGGEVRFLITDSYLISKGGFLGPEDYIREQTTEDTRPVLGGRYQVRDVVVNDWGVPMVALEGLVDPVPEDFLVPSHLVMDCPFSVGDRLRFAVEDAPNSLFVTMGFGVRPQRVSDLEIRVRGVINHFYVQLTLGGTAQSFPFVWTDFECDSEHRR